MINSLGTSTYRDKLFASLGSYAFPLESILHRDVWPPLPVTFPCITLFAFEEGGILRGLKSIFLEI